ncbi:MAG: hypothetical protein HY814_02140 [Candidatus Riflebacteria bacterium]|nr:hypothetical protein [Candidatus Riflebacteria bacterium]
MIRVNLLKVKRRKAIEIPFGWIAVVAVAIVAFGSLLLVNMTRQAQLEDKQKELDKFAKQAASLKQQESIKKAKEKELGGVKDNKIEYEKLLAAKTGGWTPTLLLWEDVLKEAKTVWFRDMRIDSDGRVIVNGVSMKNEKSGKKFDGIVELLNQLTKRPTKFKSPRIKRITKTKEKKEDVAQFELNCVLIR